MQQENGKIPESPQSGRAFKLGMRLNLENGPVAGGPGTTQGKYHLIINDIGRPKKLVGGLAAAQDNVPRWRLVDGWANTWNNLTKPNAKSQSVRKTTRWGGLNA